MNGAGQTSKIEVEFTHLIEMAPILGGESEFLIGATVQFDYDSNYGADADGRRGWPAYFDPAVDINYVRKELIDNSVLDLDIDKIFTSSQIESINDAAVREAEDIINDGDLR